MSRYSFDRIRHIDLLKYEEKISLWALRKLLGGTHSHKGEGLAHLAGDEFSSLQESFRGFSLHTVNAVSHQEVSSTEMHLLQVMAEMQNVFEEKAIVSGLKRALMHLSMILAAQGYWLPYSELQLMGGETAQPTPLQDNYPAMMQAAE